MYFSVHGVNTSKSYPNRRRISNGRTASPSDRPPSQSPASRPVHHAPESTQADTTATATATATAAISPRTTHTSSFIDDCTARTSWHDLSLGLDARRDVARSLRPPHRQRL
ncbi:hypothetical protein DHEL01_v201001 [Diaporthe helianthi]|uniref:Uncharacterized protein n=1 Tax=Diaporthe helianthi TaxID=158607 RepID=A0A2P5IDR4_DIAHE|nr:hypothetical protein DHEL01_v201001 [Diaporthe helianthi]